MAGHACAACQRQEFALEADQAACRDAVFDANPAFAVGLHVLEFAATAAQFFHDRALVVFFDVDGEQFVGLAFHAINILENHPRARDGQFVAFAAHIFDEDGQMQLAPAGNQEDVGILGVLDAQGNIGKQFLVQTLTNLAAGDEFAFLTRKGRGIDLEIHRQGGLVDLQRWQGHELVGLAEGHANTDLFNAGDEHDVACFGLLGLLAFKPLED